ncbi:hybrid sensor histidine kinase/response regulator [Stagnihabitans tardus]|uniref:histidine kinase n=1 Tax=Stagnihabitans tardus TaxID=2699202 RepID=A0AAE4Y7Z3_9RHOB|nr:PAS domain-containing hybrid sensor histidine kinase/response regulator [Stagnihabitans tardus]NBZ86516.1 response regulator [Stagnihabitans tardus]
MAESTTESEVLTDLKRLEHRMSPPGRLLSFAHARLRAFPLRLALTFYGVFVLALLEDARLALALALLSLIGETVDALGLRTAIAWTERDMARGMESRRPLRVIALATTLQSLTLVASIDLAWSKSGPHEMHFFAAVFLVAALINAGYGRVYLPQIADLRMAIYLSAGVVMNLWEFVSTPGGFSREHLYFAASFLLLVILAAIFVRTAERNHQHRRLSEYRLLKHQQEQELARAALARHAAESERLALVAQYANDSILVCGPDGRIEWVNDTFTRITGYAMAEVLGHLPAEVLNADDTDPATTSRLVEARRRQQPLRVEVLNRGKSGRLFWIETSITPIFDDDGTLTRWIAVEREVTEAKAREAELARARAAAEEAAQSKSRFLANMSHEIRTPMNGVIGVAELLSQTRLNATQRDYVETILDSGRLLLEIINDILDLAKLQSGNQPLEAKPFELQATVEGVVRILTPVASKKGIRLRAEIEGEATVLGDEGKLRQILVNLVGNAVKFTLTGEVVIKVRPPIVAGQMLEIAVQDTGIGIAPDRIQRIFESFAQADNGISRQFGGTGLGLTISSMLAERMGGGISVRSEIGHGSTFTLRVDMPLTRLSPAEAPLPSTAALRPGLRILVAEDNRTNMMILRKMLKDQVAALIEAEDGEEAVRLWHETQPDLVLMDVLMPKKDGLQATREIRAAEAEGGGHCPVLALTANAFGEDRAACLTAGMDGFLVKPLSKSDLIAAISRHCPSEPLRDTG